MMFKLPKLKTLGTQIRSFTRKWAFYRTYNPGCCEEQGIQHRGYRVILLGKYVIECGLWGQRDHCGQHPVCY